jgi:hypothetical protein
MHFIQRISLVLLLLPVLAWCDEPANQSHSEFAQRIDELLEQRLRMTVSFSDAFSLICKVPFPALVKCVLFATTRKLISGRC